MNGRVQSLPDGAGRKLVAGAALARCSCPPRRDRRRAHRRRSRQNRYSNPEIEIDQGEKVIFRNNDVATHDVTAEQKGPDGKPLFASELIDRGEEAEVEGADIAHDRQLRATSARCTRR